MFLFWCTLIYVHSSIAIILMGKREHVAWINLSSQCLMMVERLFLAVPRGCLRFVIVIFTDHTHLLFLKGITKYSNMVANVCPQIPPDPGDGYNRSKFIFSEHDHLAYQIKGKHECSNLVANI